MAHQAAIAASPADPKEVAPIQGGGDERIIVVAALIRFKAALLKSDALADDDSLAGAKRVHKKTLADEARLLAACADMKVSRDYLVAYEIAVHRAHVPSP